MNWRSKTDGRAASSCQDSPACSLFQILLTPEAQAKWYRELDSAEKAHSPLGSWKAGLLAPKQIALCKAIFHGNAVFCVLLEVCIFKAYGPFSRGGESSLNNHQDNR